MRFTEICTPKSMYYFASKMQYHGLAYLVPFYDGNMGSGNNKMYCLK